MNTSIAKAASALRIVLTFATSHTVALADGCYIQLHSPCQACASPLDCGSFAAHYHCCCQPTCLEAPVGVYAFEHAAVSLYASSAWITLWNATLPRSPGSISREVSTANNLLFLIPKGSGFKRLAIRTYPDCDGRDSLYVNRSGEVDASRWIATCRSLCRRSNRLRQDSENSRSGLGSTNHSRQCLTRSPF